MKIGKNSKKWLERIVLSCLIVVGIIFYGWLFFSTNFIHPFIHYLDLRGSIIYYKEPTNIIASNVLGFDEVRGKIYYITTNGIGIYNELNNDHVFILHKEPPNEIRMNDITNVYPEFSRFSDSEQEVWKSKFYADFRERIPIEEGNIIRFPFFLYIENPRIVRGFSKSFSVASSKSYSFRVRLDCGPSTAIKTLKEAI